MRESKVIGGIGDKKSNGGTQWYLQDRIYEGDIAITVATCCNPYYVVGEKNMGEMTKKVCDEALKNNLVTPNDVIECTYANARLSEIKDGYIKTQNRTNNQIMSTLKTNPDQLGITVEEKDMNNLAIRKLTPRECWRLQGFAVRKEDGTFDDSLFEKAKEVNSDSQLYKQAGNSITVDVLYNIFGSLFKEELKEDK